MLRQPTPSRRIRSQEAEVPLSFTAVVSCEHLWWLRLLLQGATRESSCEFACGRVPRWQAHVLSRVPGSGVRSQGALPTGGL